MSKTFYIAGAIALAAIGFLALRPTASAPQKEKNNYRYIAEATAPKDFEFQKWHEYSPPSGKFKVLLPTLPQQAQEKLQDPNTKETRQYEMYVSEKEDGTIFMISVITMLETGQNKIDDGVLKKVVNDLMTTNPKNKVKKMEKGSYKEYPAMEFSIENDQVNIDGKAFLAGTTLYLLTSAAQLQNYQRPEFDFFVNSFQLTPAAAVR